MRLLLSHYGVLGFFGFGEGLVGSIVPTESKRSDLFISSVGWVCVSSTMVTSALSRTSAPMVVRSVVDALAAVAAKAIEAARIAVLSVRMGISFWSLINKLFNKVRSFREHVYSITTALSCQHNN